MAGLVLMRGAVSRGMSKSEATAEYSLRTGKASSHIQ